MANVLAAKFTIQFTNLNPDPNEMTQFVIHTLVALLLLPCLVCGQNKNTAVEGGKKVIPLDVVADLVKKQGDNVYHADVRLRNLPAGQTARLNVVLRNPSDQVVKFSGVSNKCKCRRFKKQSAEIEPGGEGAISFDFAIPARHKQKKVESGITLVYKGVSVIKLNISYELDGLLAFGGLMSIVRFDDVAEIEKKIEIPLFVTPPLSWEKVKLETSSNLKGIRTSIEYEQDGPKVRARIPVTLLERGNVRGELYLSNPGGWESDTFMLSVKDSRQHEISPQVLIFKKMKDGSSRATAVIKVAGFSDASSESLDLSASIGEQQLDVKTKLLGGNTYRIEMRTRVPIESIDDASQRLTWKILVGNLATEMTSEFIFEK